MKQEEPTQSNTTESRSSVTYNLISKAGYPFLFTVRRDDEAELLDVMEDLEGTFLDRGYEADKKGSYQARPKPPAEVVAGKTCPRCGAGIVKFTTKTGKTGEQCETRKYDFVTKTTTGCDYIAWDA